MSWDDKGGDKDPWGQKRNDQGPPNLDEALRKFQTKVRALFGNKGSKGGGQGKGIMSAMGIGGIIVVILVLWVLSGIYIVSPAERAVVLRFGKYLETVEPGPHWIPRFIDSRYTLNVQQVSTYPYQAEMLTKDENIVSVAVAVQYRVDNARNYLFSVVSPVASLQQATASALRQVVGHTTLDSVLTTGRQQIREQVGKQLKAILALYKTGILVTDVTLQPAKPPEQVTAAFDDAIKAREDEQRYVNQAEAYSKKVIPIAKGQAQRILEAAQAYQQQVVLQAQGATAEFLALLPEYERSPKVTRERLYLNAVESMLMKSSKVLVDVKGGNNILYLPLDKIIREQQDSSETTITDKIKSQASATSTDGQTSASTKSALLGYPTRGSN